MTDPALSTCPYCRSRSIPRGAKLYAAPFLPAQCPKCQGLVAIKGWGGLYGALVELAILAPILAGVSFETAVLVAAVFAATTWLCGLLIEFSPVGLREVTQSRVVAGCLVAVILLVFGYIAVQEGQ